MTLGRRLLVCGILGFAAIGGSAARAETAKTPDPVCMAESPAGLEAYWRAICSSRPQDVTLHRLRAGLAALQMGFTAPAEKQLNAAASAIETIYADGDAAAKARAEWAASKHRGFLGDPQERVMAFYYLGLLGLFSNDWEKASHAFASAALQDGFIGTERRSANAAFTVWLQGWTQHCLGHDEEAKQLTAKAEGLDPSLSKLKIDAAGLVIAEPGHAPRKLPYGQQNEFIELREGSPGVTGLQITDGKGRASMIEVDDLFQQALQYNMPDEARTNAAALQTAATTAAPHVVATGALTTAAGQITGAHAVSSVGQGTMLIGLLAAGIAAAQDNSADIRSWDNLPHSVFFATQDKAASHSTGLVDAAGHSVLSGADGVKIAANDRCGLAWIANSEIIPPPVAPQPVAEVAPTTTAASGGDICRLSSGAEKPLAADLCKRIGGTPVQP